MSFDVDAILHQNSLRALVSQHSALKRDGNEWRGLCPFHQERTPSFSVYMGRDGTERYMCFGCGAKGNAIDYVMAFRAVDFKEACTMLGGKVELGSVAATRREAQAVEHVDVYAGWEPILPVGSRELLAGKNTGPIENPKRAAEEGYEPRGFVPSLVHPYRNASGETLFYVLRRDFERDGKQGKETPCVMWCRKPDGSEAWTRIRPELPYPLYGLDRLAAKPNAPVLVVEGEKSADAGQIMLAGWVVVSWLGGTNGWDKSDWSPLSGRRVTVMPDNDEVGEKTARAIAEHLLGSAEQVRLIERDGKQAKGWDIADALAEGWDGAAFAAWAKPRITVLEEEPEYSHDNIEPSYSDDEPEPQESAAPGVFTESPFRILGHMHGTYYYMSNKTQQITELEASQHTKLNLLKLAPLEHWQTVFMGSGEKVWEQAANALIQSSHNKGLYDSTMLRGRGAWEDEGRAVLHTGDKVLVDGEAHNPALVPSRYIYESGHAIDIHAQGEVASTADAHKLLEVCRLLTWERPLSATLLAGWCVIAPVCGILNWRPHIWVTGPAGSGKSTVMQYIVSRVLGDTVLKVEGKTTEAAIRQLLGRDARPLIFDEAESEDQRAAQNMRAVLDLARLASSGGKVVKGSKDGRNPLVYMIRSCFCFSAINPAVKEYADETRITKLALKKNLRPDAKAQYEKLQHIIFSTFTPEYSGRLLARTVQHMNVLRENVKVFTEAAALVLGDIRIADQIGTMLAGAYLLHSAKVIDREKAMEWIRSHDWSQHTALEAQRDEEKLVSQIATQRVRVKRAAGFEEVSLGELMEIASTKYDSDANKDLKTYGIKVEGDYVVIANSSRPLADLLKDTTWKAGWSGQLRQLEGSSITDNSLYFAPGIKSRATLVPVRYFVGDNAEDSLPEPADFWES